MHMHTHEQISFAHPILQSVIYSHGFPPFAPQQLEGRWRMLGRPGILQQVNLSSSISVKEWLYVFRFRLCGIVPHSTVLRFRMFGWQTHSEGSCLASLSLHGRLWRFLQQASICLSLLLKSSWTLTYTVTLLWFCLPSSNLQKQLVSLMPTQQHH